MISRYFVSFNFAALLTFGLFFALQMLIAGSDIILEEKIARPKVIFGELPEPELRTDVIEQPLRPDVLETIDVTPIALTRDKGGPIVYPDDDLKGEMDPTIPDTPASIFQSEGDFIALIRPAPQYPAVMSDKGIEGFVRLKYTINEFGATENIVIIESSHRGFERSAVKAAEKFKFKPRVENGQPHAVHNVYSRLEFKLQS